MTETKRKNNRGRETEGMRQWFLVMVEAVILDNNTYKADGRIVICRLKKRDIITIIPLILLFVDDGSLVLTDGWKPYQFLRNLGWNHHWVNHTHIFVDPWDSSVNSQLVERVNLWIRKEMQCYSQHAGAMDYDIGCLMYMFYKCRRENGELKSIGQLMETIIKDLNTVYPGPGRPKLGYPEFVTRFDEGNDPEDWPPGNPVIGINFRGADSDYGLINPALEAEFDAIDAQEPTDVTELNNNPNIIDSDCEK